jgi:hypothetical protein
MKHILRAHVILLIVMNKLNEDEIPNIIPRGLQLARGVILSWWMVHYSFHWNRNRELIGGGNSLTWERDDFDLSLYLFIYLIFFNQVYCARGTIPKLHIKVTGGSRERMSELSTNQTHWYYESRISPLSLPLNGGSLRGQAIPACCRYAPIYCPENMNTCELRRTAN